MPRQIQRMVKSIVAIFGWSDPRLAASASSIQNQGRAGPGAGGQLGGRMRVPGTGLGTQQICIPIGLSYVIRKNE